MSTGQASSPAGPPAATTSARSAPPRRSSIPFIVGYGFAAAARRPNRACNFSWLGFRERRAAPPPATARDNAARRAREFIHSSQVQTIANSAFFFAFTNDFLLQPAHRRRNPIFLPRRDPLDFSPI